MNAVDYLNAARGFIEAREPQRALACLNEAARRLGEVANDVADMEQHIGVIVGVSRDIDLPTAERVSTELREQFPGVTFAVMPHTSSIWFPLPNGAHDASAVDAHT